MNKLSYGFLAAGALGAAALVFGAGSHTRDANDPAVDAAVSDPVPTRAAARPRAQLVPSASASRAGLTSTHVVTDAEIDAMETRQLESEVALVDAELADARAIERLNADQVSPDERESLRLLLDRGARLRAALAERDLEGMMDAVDDYARTHDRRVAELLKEEP